MHVSSKVLIHRMFVSHSLLRKLKRWVCFYQDQLEEFLTNVDFSRVNIHNRFENTNDPRKQEPLRQEKSSKIFVWDRILEDDISNF